MRLFDTKKVRGHPRFLVHIDESDWRGEPLTKADFEAIRRQIESWDLVNPNSVLVLPCRVTVMEAGEGE